MATNPLIQQGTLNRIRCHIVVASFPGLNIASSYMGKALASVSFDDQFTDQIPTATGLVNSPAPYVYTSVTVSLIRTQPLAQAWLTQANETSVLGDVVVHSDTAAFPAITVANTSIIRLEPGNFGGTNPEVQLTLRGIYYTNNNLWNAL